MKRIVKYLLGTWHVGMQAGINHDIRLTACADLDFANRWNKLNPEDASCFHSRTGYIIYCVSAPIAQCSKSQFRKVLSSAEVEHMALSTCLRDLILIMRLIAEISSHIQVQCQRQVIKCRLFKDNKSCIKIAKAPILILHTKHITLECHHFRWYVDHSLVLLESIRTGEQTDNLLTKPVPDLLFNCL